MIVAISVACGAGTLIVDLTGSDGDWTLTVTQTDTAGNTSVGTQSTDATGAIISTQKARIASYRAAIKQVLKDLPLIYLWHPINRFGVVRTVSGVQVYSDGLIRAQFAGFKK